jgi:hypothetical protein
VRRADLGRHRLALIELLISSSAPHVRCFTSICRLQDGSLLGWLATAAGVHDAVPVRSPMLRDLICIVFLGRDQVWPVATPSTQSLSELNRVDGRGTVVFVGIGLSLHILVRLLILSIVDSAIR